MIVRESIDGREATVAYLTLDRKPSDPGSAQIVHVSFDDGESLWAYPVNDDDNPDGDGDDVGDDAPLIPSMGDNAASGLERAADALTIAAKADKSGQDSTLPPNSAIPPRIATPKTPSKTAQRRDYIANLYGDALPDTWTAEHEMALPESLRDLSWIEEENPEPERL